MKHFFKTFCAIGLILSLSCAKKSILIENQLDEYAWNGRMLVMGTSITKSDTSEHWWGQWGMAATEREKDFVHVLKAFLAQHVDSVQLSFCDITEWEQKHSTYNVIRFDTLFVDPPELIILQTGKEVITDLDIFEKSLSSLVSYLKLKAPDATIVVLGNYWKSNDKEYAIYNACRDTEVIYIKINHLNNLTNRSALGTSVFGDDLNWHTINDDAVARHPNDHGMANIARAIYAALLNRWNNNE